MHFVFMGVSGSGKSTVAVAVARRLGLPLAEADAFHPPANIAKMSAGVPLTDTDREPWLRALAEWIAERERAGEHSAMACSALRRDYRDILRSGAPDVRFVHLDGGVDLIAARLRERSGHFMPAGLLASQAATLEPLAPDEPGTVLDIGASPEELIGRAEAELAAALRERE
ncbi:gluconate kinase (SKI family) [Murinocardiopsis flavida]|uniref:Gluconokinase n=1 Tax=Murinocardiopsis flavida TaxID=645275 RepID=A0A2P8DKS3_9ACTN|nr:gluconokinase [Murinocardiopsis flavida]PSK97813.1 gluconate kinase (SKI family) [Murinocardiopsis flavida]